jgi:hypothetical protein
MLCSANVYSANVSQEAETCLIHHSVVLTNEAIPVWVWTGSDASRRLRLPEFIGNQRMKVVGLSALCDGCVYTQEIFLVDRKASVNENFRWHHQELNLGPSSLRHNASTNCTTTCPQYWVVTTARPISLSCFQLATSFLIIVNCGNEAILLNCNKSSCFVVFREAPFSSGCVHHQFCLQAIGLCFSQWESCCLRSGLLPWDFSLCRSPSFS